MTRQIVLSRKSRTLMISLAKTDLMLHERSSVRVVCRTSYIQVSECVNRPVLRQGPQSQGQRAIVASASSSSPRRRAQPQASIRRRASTRAWRSSNRRARCSWTSARKSGIGPRSATAGSWRCGSVWQPQQASNHRPQMLRDRAVRAAARNNHPWVTTGTGLRPVPGSPYFV